MYKEPDQEEIKRVVELGVKKIDNRKVHETVTREKDLNEKFAKVPSWFDKQVNKLKLLFSLLKDYYYGNYTEIPWTSIALITFAIIYFISPIDLIPDVIPVVGYIDDAAVIGFVWEAIEHDLKIYAQKTGKDLSLFW